jgi:DNA-binding transcriptional regulator LsrR (DeoR family)
MNTIINYFFSKINLIYNQNIMDVKTKIKMLAVSRGITLKKLAEKLSEIHGKNYSYNSLLGKLNRESLSLKEAITIAEILNYKLEFIDNYK